MAHPALGDYLHGLWSELLAWLHDDLATTDSNPPAAGRARPRSLGDRLQADASDAPLDQRADRAPRRARSSATARTSGRYIVERVGEWNADEMTIELERHIGRDLQFIRVNGTLVGGLVGLAIHSATQLAQHLR